MSIAIGWADYGSVKSEFMFSVANTVKYDSMKRNLISNVIGATASALSRGKNSVVKTFLFETDAEWLLMMDADTVWHEDSIYRLYDLATSKDIKVLSAIYFIRPNGQYSTPIPAAYNIVENDNIPIDLKNNLDKEIIRVDWTGGGAVLIHRDCLANITKRTSTNIDFWFKEGIGEEYCGEDFYLFNSIRKFGYDIYCTPQVIIPHIKQQTITLENYINES